MPPVWVRVKVPPWGMNTGTDCVCGSAKPEGNVFVEITWTVPLASTAPLIFNVTVSDPDSAATSTSSARVFAVDGDERVCSVPGVAVWVPDASMITRNHARTPENPNRWPLLRCPRR